MDGGAGEGMTIHIPVWLLWVLGVPVGLVMLFFLMAGIAFTVAFWDWPGL